MLLHLRKSKKGKWNTTFIDSKKEKILLVAWSVYFEKLLRLKYNYRTDKSFPNNSKASKAIPAQCYISYI